MNEYYKRSVPYFITNEEIYKYIEDEIYNIYRDNIPYDFMYNTLKMSHTEYSLKIETENYNREELFEIFSSFMSGSKYHCVYPLEYILNVESLEKVIYIHFNYTEIPKSFLMLDKKSGLINLIITHNIPVYCCYLTELRSKYIENKTMELYETEIIENIDNPELLNIYMCYLNMLDIDESVKNVIFHYEKNKPIIYTYDIYNICLSNITKKKEIIYKFLTTNTEIKKIKIKKSEIMDIIECVVLYINNIENKIIYHSITTLPEICSHIDTTNMTLNLKTFII